MSASSWWRLLAAGALAFAALPVLASISIEIGNGDQVEGELSAPDDVQRFRVFVPEGAKLTAVVKGVKERGGSAPAMSLRILDEAEDDISDGLVKTKKSGAKAKVAVELTGEHIVEVFGDGASTGRYRLTAKWSSPKTFKIKGEELFDEGDEIDVFAAVDGDALLTMKIKATKGSTAKPFFDRIEYDLAIDPEETEFDQDLDDAPSLKKIVALGRGDAAFVIGNESGEGGIAGVIKVKAPKPARRKIMVTDDQLQGDEGKAATGAVVSPAKSNVVQTNDPAIVGAGLGVASVLVPAGAVTKPTTILIGSSPARPPPSGTGLNGAGPTIFFGPSGLQFQGSVTVTIPFDPASIPGGDTSGLQVFTRDANGNVTEITGFTVNVADGTVTFPVSHFSSFRVFNRPPPAPFDLNGDNVNDLVIPAPGFGSGDVHVFFGPFDPQTGEITTAAADLTIVGGLNSGFGKFVTIGDVNGDQRPDLVVLGTAVNDGSVHVFFGGPGFGPTSRTQANVTINGAVGHRGFSKAAIGDVNDDGRGDLVLSAEEGPSGQGTVWVFFGGPNLANGTTSAANLAFTGEQQGDLFGAEILVADVTGDGKTDLIIGADMIDNPGRTGKVYVVPGGAAISSGPAAGLPIILSGSGPDAGFGLNVAAGDLTGDGVADLAVSEFDDISGGPGRVYVFRGGTTLQSGGPTSSLGNFVGDGPNDLLGSALQIADLDGDGSRELIMGARGAESDAGALYVVNLEGLEGPDSSPGLALVKGEGASEGFPRLAPPRRLAGSMAVIAFAPFNSEGAINSGAAYVFLSPPPARSTADAAEIVIRGQLNEFIGNDDEPLQ